MTGTSKPGVLSVGRLYCDLIFTGLPRLPSLGTEVFTEGFGAHAGGGAFITAAHLSALGHGSALAAMLPAPPFHDFVRRDLEASHIDLSLSKTLPATEGPQITVAMAQGGDRAFLTRRAGPAFPDLQARDLRAHGFGHLHIGELASLVSQPEIIDIARTQDMTISVDCGWEDTLDCEALRPLAGRVDLFLPNEAEWEALCQTGLAEGFAPTTIIKRGAKGASALTESGRVDTPTQPIDAMDTTGAGDAFNAGFLSCWLTGGALPACLAAGNARGALAVQRRGGFAAGTDDRESHLGVAGA